MTLLQFMMCHKARIFLLVDLQTLLLYFSGKQKKNNSKIFFLFHPPSLNIYYLLVEKNITFLRCTNLLKEIVLCRFLGKL